MRFQDEFYFRKKVILIKGLNKIQLGKLILIKGLNKIQLGKLSKLNYFHPLDVSEYLSM